MFWKRKKKGEPKVWYVKGGEIRKLSQAIFDSEHTLIGGTTGCGKSTLENAIIGDLLKSYAPSEARLVLLDPKRLDLIKYKELPHTIRYEYTADGAVESLRWAVGEMNRRYAVTQRERKFAWSGSKIYIIIDEIMPLVLSERSREFKNLLSLLLTQGRASGIHIIASTQCPNREVLNKNIKPLFDTRVGMRCADPIESRELVGVKGCEALPKNGRAIVKYDGILHDVEIPMTDYKEVDSLIEYWTSSKCYA